MATKPKAPAAAKKTAKVVDKILKTIPAEQRSKHLDAAVEGLKETHAAVRNSIEPRKTTKVVDKVIIKPPASVKRVEKILKAVPGVHIEKSRVVADEKKEHLAAVKDLKKATTAAEKALGPTLEKLAQKSTPSVKASPALQKLKAQQPRAVAQTKSAPVIGRTANLPHKEAAVERNTIRKIAGEVVQEQLSKTAPRRVQAYTPVVEKATATQAAVPVTAPLSAKKAPPAAPKSRFVSAADLANIATKAEAAAEVVRPAATLPQPKAAVPKPAAPPAGKVAFPSGLYGNTAQGVQVPPNLPVFKTR